MAREAGATLRCERWRGTLLVIVAAVITIGALGLDLREVDEIEASAARLDAAGKRVFTVQADDATASIEATRCAALGLNPAVQASAAVSEPRRATISKAPGEMVHVRTATPDIIRILAPGSSIRAEAYAAKPLAERIGLSQDIAVRLVEQSGPQSGPVRVAALEMSARLPDPGPWIWRIEAPTGLVTECWVEMRPGATAHAREFLVNWLSTGETPVHARPLLSEDRFALDPVTQYLARPTALAWVAGGALAGVWFGLTIWFRRREIGLLRSVGASKGQGICVYLLPAAFLVVAGVFAGAAWVVFGSWLRSGTDTGAMVRIGLQAGGLAGVACAVAGLAITVSALVPSARDVVPRD